MKQIARESEDRPGCKRSILRLAAEVLVAATFLSACPANSLLTNVKEHVQAAKLGVAWASPYANGCQIAAIEELQVTSTSADLQSAGISVSGIGPGIGTLGADNRTITVKPGASGTGLWTGPGTLTVTATTVDGSQFTKTLVIGGVFNGICVSSTRGSDAVPNNGSVRLPFLTVKKGADTAATKYGAAANSVRVASSATPYLVDGRSATARVVLSPTTSLLGEYADDFQSRSIGTPPATIISDSNVSPDSSSGTNPNRVIEFTAGSAATLEGFIVNGGTGSYATAVYCKDASPTIVSMTIRSGGNGGANTQRAGLWIEGAASPTVLTNTFNDGVYGGGTLIAESDAIFVNVITGTPVIQNNLLCGGTAATGGGGTIGISISGGTSSSLKIWKNTFIPGNGDPVIGLLYVSGSANVSFANNLVEVGGPLATLVSRGVAVFGTSSKISIRNNSFILGYPITPVNEYGIHFNGIGTASTVNVDNNIFHYYGASSTIYGVFELGASTPDLFRNNLFSNFTTRSLTLYHNSDGTNYLTTGTMEIGITGEGGAASGNFTLDPIGFVNAAGGNFHLSAPNVQGLDGGALGWGFADDRDGVARTGNGVTGWSVGCYEKD